MDKEKFRLKADRYNNIYFVNAITNQEYHIGDEYTIPDFVTKGSRKRHLPSRVSISQIILE